MGATFLFGSARRAALLENVGWAGVAGLVGTGDGAERRCPFRLGLAREARRRWFDLVEAAGEGVHSGKSAATTALGKPGVLHSSKTLFMQTEDGQVVEPHSISAGLDYPGIGPIHAHLFDVGRAKFLSATDKEALDAVALLARTEGIIPALESAHAIAALEKINLTKDDVVVLNLSGRGDKDLDTYIREINF